MPVSGYSYRTYPILSVKNLPDNFLKFFFATATQSSQFAGLTNFAAVLGNCKYFLPTLFVTHSVHWWAWSALILAAAPFARRFTAFCNHVLFADSSTPKLNKQALEGVLHIGVKRRFVGITLSVPKHTNKLECNYLASCLGAVLPTPDSQCKTILTLSNTLVLKLYSLQRTVKLTQPLLLLMIRLLRRYLVTLRLKRLSIHLGNFGESLPFLWRTLITPLNEVFNHPRALRLIGDLGMDAGLSHYNATSKLSLGNRLFAFLEQYKSKTSAYFAYAAASNSSNNTASAISQAFTSNFVSLWSAFCRTFLLNCKLTNHPFSDKRIFSNFCLTITFCQFTTNPRRAWVYRKKLRSLKRRLVKRVTREATKRLWLF
jgi:hypothetical protein